MALTQAEVEHIALLARLRLSPAEVARFQEQLSAILDHVSRLQALDTAGIDPTASVLALTSVLRPDVARPSLPPGALLANAPAVEAQFFQVPPVLD